MKPRFFRSPAEFRAWLSKNHARAGELLVGFHKKGSGKPSMTWPESVDEALCFGWIDGIRKRLDDESYTIRFTPRRARSTWSTVNVKRAGALSALGLMQPSGLKAFAARKENRSGIYAYEQRSETLPEPYARTMKKNESAWSFFQAQPPSYRKMVDWWVVSAKKEETRLRRLAQLIEDSARGRRRRFHGTTRCVSSRDQRRRSHGDDGQAAPDLRSVVFRRRRDVRRQRQRALLVTIEEPIGARAENRESPPGLTGVRGRDVHPDGTRGRRDCVVQSRFPRRRSLRPVRFALGSWPSQWTPLPRNL